MSVATKTPPAAPAASAASVRRAYQLLSVVSTWSLPVLLAVVLLVAWATTPSFLTFENIRGILINTAVIGTIAVGMTPITLSGNGVSLAISQSAMLASITFIALQAAGVNMWIAIGAVFIILMLVGAAQGVIVAAGLNPLITTLAVGAVIFGVATLASDGAVIVAPNTDFRWIATAAWLGIPLPVYIFLGFTILCQFFIARTTAGRNLMLAGANHLTARLSAISRTRVTIIAFLIFSIGASLGGIIVASQTGQATSSDLATIMESVLAAVLVGGAAIQGGSGSPIRSAAGALLIAIFTNAMVLHDFPYGVRLTAVGALVLLVVSVLHTLRKKAGQ